MNPEITSINWSEIKGKIKAKFTRLTEENVESVKSNIDMLAGKLQGAYGYAKEQAEKEVASFKATLHPISAVAAGDKHEAVPETKSVAEAQKAPQGASTTTDGNKKSA